MNIYKVSVFNTTTNKYEEIEVTEEVYEVYRTSEWQLENDDRRYRKHNTNFSEFGTDADSYFEKISSYVEACDSHYRRHLSQLEFHQLLTKALKTLKKEDRDLIRALYYEGFTEKTYAERLGVNQSVISRKRKRILRDLRKDFEDFS